MTRQRSSRWAGYAAALVAAAFAMVNLAWALGSDVGLSTLGGQVEQLARSGDRRMALANAAAVVVKLCGAALALALVQPWGRRLPRRLLVVTARIGAVVLILYGALQLTGLLLVVVGVSEPGPALTPRVLRWRLLLWEPWFVVWGVLLAVATTGGPLGRPARQPANHEAA